MTANTIERITNKAKPLSRYVMGNLPNTIKCAPVFLAGGAIPSLMFDLVPRDFDLFCYTQNYVQYFRSIFEKEGKYESHGITVVAITDNAITFYLNNVQEEGGIDLLRRPFQLITKHWGAPVDVIKTFDLSPCMCYYHYGLRGFNIGTDDIGVAPEAYESFEKQILTVNPAIKKDPAPYRLEKYKRKGWKIETRLHAILDEVVKIGDEVNKVSKVGDKEEFYDF